MIGACALYVLVHCLAPESTIYALRSGEGRKLRACRRQELGEEIMIRPKAMQIHRSDGYRDHYALLAPVFTLFFISSGYDEAFERGV